MTLIRGRAHTRRGAGRPVDLQRPAWWVTSYIAGAGPPFVTPHLMRQPSLVWFTSSM